MLLTSCAFSFGPGGAPPVDFEGIQGATIQIGSQGTFIEPGTSTPMESGGFGSGFFIGPDGYALTNNHVVVGAGLIKVWVGGDTSKEYTARLLGSSECLDLAVIKIDGEFPYMAWHEGEIKPALEAYSLGFPHGNPTFTVTKGIVSKADIKRTDSWATLDHAIEHDARIRGGNSGGPLVSNEGRVIGVNYAGSDTFDYNFAIHRDQVLPVVETLRSGEDVLSLGLNVEALPPTEQGEARGVWVTSVRAGGIGDKAGVKPGDLLLDMAGIGMGRGGTLEAYCEVLKTQGTDATMDFTVYRPGEEATYKGQFNGKEAERVSASGGGNSGGGSGQAPDTGGFVMVSDNSNTVFVSVPSSWTDRFGDPFTEDGATFYNLNASPNLQRSRDGWDTPSVRVFASNDTSLTPNDIMNIYRDDMTGLCNLNNEGTYNDGYYDGLFLYFDGCGGTNTHYVVISGIDPNRTHLATLVAVLVSDQDKGPVLDQMTDTFEGRF